MIAFKIDPGTLYSLDKLALETGLGELTIRGAIVGGQLRSACIGLTDFVLGSWFLGYLDRIATREAPCPAPSKAPSASPARKG